MELSPYIFEGEELNWVVNNICKYFFKFLTHYFSLLLLLVA